jgi:hypothetical protein
MLPSCANCLEILGDHISESLGAFPGLYKYSFYCYSVAMSYCFHYNSTSVNHYVGIVTVCIHFVPCYSVSTVFALIVCSKVLGLFF